MRIKVFLGIIFIADIIPFIFLFSMEKGNFMSGTSLLVIYTFLWIIKILLAFRILSKPSLDIWNAFFLIMILAIFGYIQYLNYQFIYKIT